MSHRSNHSIDLNTNFSPSKATSQPATNVISGAISNIDSTPKQNRNVLIRHDGPTSLQKVNEYTVSSDLASGTIDSSVAMTLISDQRSDGLLVDQDEEMKPPTDMVLSDIYDVLTRDLGILTAECFKTASNQPPVTRESLAELNTSRIIVNPKLRHDINFDLDLQFRPNVDGVKGKEKKKAGVQFWHAIHAELHMYTRVQAALQHPSQSNPTLYVLAVQQLSRKRLPDLFYAIREIIRSLVPDCDHPVICDTLDVPLLMQQMDNAVCDLPALADWFANILKKHCAPMRDGLVDEMRDQLCAGACEGDMTKVTDGLRQLLNVLELMKLDVANHQIRHMRPMLVQDSVNFQIRYNAQRALQGKLDLHKCRVWFHEAKTSYLEQIQRHTDIEILCDSVVRGLLWREDLTFLPPLFNLDTERLLTMRVDLRRLVFLEICALVFEEVVEIGAEEHDKKKASKTLCITILDLIGNSNKFAKHLENVAVEIMRSVFRVEKREEKFDRQLLDFIQFRLEAEIKPCSCFYEYAVNGLCSRFITELANSVSALAQQPAQILQSMLLPVSASRAARRSGSVRRFHPYNSNSVGISAPHGPVHENSPTLDLEYGLLNRITHMLVLHWQVWREAVYQSPFLLAMPESGMPYTPEQSDDDEDLDDDGGIALDDEIKDHSARLTHRPSDPFMLSIGKTIESTTSLLPTPSPSPPPQSQSESFTEAPLPASETSAETDGSTDTEILKSMGPDASVDDSEML